MKTVHFLRMLAGALVPLGGLMAATPAGADLILDFDNARPDASTLPAFITFTGAPPGGFDATIVGTAIQLQEGVSYSLSTLSARVDVTQYTSGRVFVSLGPRRPHRQRRLRAGFRESDFAKFLDPHGQVRNHLWRPGQRRRADRRGQSELTDFFGIPLQLQTTGGSQPKTLTWNYDAAVSTAAVFQPSAPWRIIGRHGRKHPRPLVTGGANGVTINTPNGPMNGVVRIIAPSSTNQPATGSSTPYPNIGSYATYIQNNQISANIMGQNGQFGVTSGPFQNYSMAGVISNGTKTINGTLYPAGELVLTGQVTIPSGVGTTPLTVTVTQANLQSFIIYGANPAYNVTVGSDTNKVVQKIIADYFSGLNFGFIGSRRPIRTRLDRRLETRPLGRGMATNRAEAAQRRCR